MIKITMPASTGGCSRLKLEEQIQHTVNAVGRTAMHEILPRFDDVVPSFISEGRTCTTKGKISKIYETAWNK